MPRPAPLNPISARKSLANRLGPRVDRLRQLATKLGLRPYRVFLVWEKYTGAEYGVGDRKELKRIEIVPTPRVRSLDNISLNPMNAGMVPVGSVRVDLISVTYTYDQLRGFWMPDQHEDAIPEPYTFFYEVIEDGRGDAAPIHAKFRLLGLPGRLAGKVCWTLTLERVSGDNDRQGQSTYG